MAISGEGEGGIRDKSEFFAWVIVCMVASPTEAENAGGVPRLKNRVM